MAQWHPLEDMSLYSILKFKVKIDSLTSSGNITKQEFYCGPILGLYNYLWFCFTFV